MGFTVVSSADRTLVFVNEYGDRFTSRFLTDAASGMRSDVEWSDYMNLTPREGRRRLGPADEFALDHARREGWIAS